MVEHLLRGRRILVVEDEYFLADDVRDMLADAGAEVLGPAASVDEATALIARDDRFDAAVLDVNLRGDLVFSVADRLRDRGIPFAFVTGYDYSSVPDRFADVWRLEKPLQPSKVADMLATLLAA